MPTIRSSNLLHHRIYSMKIKYLIFIVLFLLLISCSADNTSKNPVVRIGRTAIEVELANTPEKRQQGLMHRTSLDAEKGMLFIFEKEQFLYFWMKNTGIPLSIAYISSSGQIIDLLDLEPYSRKLVPSSKPALYALEVNLGFFREKNIMVGDTVKFLNF